MNHELLDGVSSCLMYLEYCDDYHFDAHQIEFIISFDVRTVNKIKLLNYKLDDNFYNPIMYNINPTIVKQHFKHLISAFKNVDSNYTLPYGIMLKIMEQYDNGMYHKYKDYYVPEHDSIVIDAHIKHNRDVYQQLKALKRIYR